MIARSVDRVTAARMEQTALQRRITAYLPVLLPLPTLLLAGWAIAVWRFNGLYGQDPFAYYDYGIGPLRRSLLDGTPLTATFWPLGYPVLITLSSLLLGPGAGAGQLVNLVAAGSAVVLTYLLGRDLLLLAGADAWLARRAGTLGALLLGLSGRLIESGVLIMADQRPGREERWRPRSSLPGRWSAGRR